MHRAVAIIEPSRVLSFDREGVQSFSFNAHKQRLGGQSGWNAAMRTGRLRVVDHLTYEPNPTSPRIVLDALGREGLAVNFWTAFALAATTERLPDAESFYRRLFSERDARRIVNDLERFADYHAAHRVIQDETHF